MVLPSALLCSGVRHLTVTVDVSWQQQLLPSKLQDEDELLVAALLALPIHVLLVAVVMLHGCC
jgi:hypothetical protein